MANKTTNYGLNKPTGNDYVDINVLNENMDIIDKELHKKANSENVTNVTQLIDDKISAHAQDTSIHPTDEHINSLIDAKLGAIENGSY